MTVFRWALAAIAALVAFPASALEAGQAAGHYLRDGVKIEVSHAIALSQDNTEGLLDHGPQMRVLLSDRAVPIEALDGIAFPPVRAMAQHGELRGLLVEFSPADRNSMRVTILDKPADPDAFAPTLSLSDSNGLWRQLTADARHITGDYKSSDDTDLAFSFDAPVSTDGVAADLKGPAAQSSEQVRVLLARAEALGRGDVGAAAALSSKQSGASLRAMPAAEAKQLAAATPELVREIKTIRRVVVRHRSAVAVMGDSWSTLVLEDGAWKVDD